MTLRFHVGQLATVIALIAGLAAPITARDDDPRDFSRQNNNSRSDSRTGDYRRNDDRRSDDRNGDDDRGHHQNHNDKKVTVCHKDNQQPGGKAITVSWNAVAAHQAHGDTLGPCPVSNCR